MTLTVLWWSCNINDLPEFLYCPWHFCGILDKSLWIMKLWNMCGVPETLLMSLKLLLGLWYVCDMPGASMLSLTNLLCPRKLLKSHSQVHGVTDMPVLSLPLKLQQTKINSWPQPGVHMLEDLSRPTMSRHYIFKVSALWADAFYKSICPSVCLFVRVCVHFWGTV